LLLRNCVFAIAHKIGRVFELLHCCKIILIVRVNTSSEIAAGSSATGHDFQIIEKKKLLRSSSMARGPMSQISMPKKRPTRGNVRHSVVPSTPGVRQMPGNMAKAAAQPWFGPPRGRRRPDRTSVYLAGMAEKNANFNENQAPFGRNPGRKSDNIGCKRFAIRKRGGEAGDL
jgi:hypothetical protein